MSNIQIENPFFEFQIPNFCRRSIFWNLLIEYWKLQSNVYICTHNFCGYGEIGRHARLRIWCRKACRFESYYPHLINPLILVNQELKDFLFNISPVFPPYFPRNILLTEFQQASDESIDVYIRALESNGFVAKVCRSPGKGIDAACGQLAN